MTIFLYHFLVKEDGGNYLVIRSLSCASQMDTAASFRENIVLEIKQVEKTFSYMHHDDKDEIKEGN